MVTMEMHEAQSASRSRALGAAGQPAIDMCYMPAIASSSTALAMETAGPRPRLASYSLASLTLTSRSCAGASIDASLSGVRMSSLYSAQAGPTKISDFSHIYATCKAGLKR